MQRGRSRDDGRRRRVQYKVPCDTTCIYLARRFYSFIFIVSDVHIIIINFIYLESAGRGKPCVSLYTYAVCTAARSSTETGACRTGCTSISRSLILCEYINILLIISSPGHFAEKTIRSLLLRYRTVCDTLLLLLLLVF